MSNNLLKNNINDFVEKRIKLLQSGEGDMYEKCTDPYLVVHYISLFAFENDSIVDTNKHLQGDEIKYIPLLYIPKGLDCIKNENGLLFYSGIVREGFDPYHHCTQVFRNGIIEMRKKIDYENIKILPNKIEKYLQSAFSTYKGYLDKYQIKLPILFYINMLNISGYELSIMQSVDENHINRQDKPNLNATEIQTFDSGFESNFKNTLESFYSIFYQNRPKK